ncbi:RrF2 family transcriptional regulator [Crateriforma conspicua]|uniref:Transcriptional repressor NsrR n=1 Tax=Crateriforma conspicua TaxID=2527996 RepID=A0A5C6FP99_9PLAN|nr:Rrf2 family transcriptional regulator [Crateriforma conspicua]TWU62213.1 transcriptional repressor NsrR [Crateriforma conspicua]
MLSKTAEYALRVVIALAQRRGEVTSASTLSELTHVPRRYLNHVLQDLVACGITASRSGSAGGHQLVADPAKTTLVDVLRHVSPLQRIDCCPLGLKSHTSLCPLHASLDRAYALAEESFGNMTLQQMVDSPDAELLFHAACEGCGQ